MLKKLINYFNFQFKKAYVQVNEKLTKKTVIKIFENDNTFTIKHFIVFRKKLKLLKLKNLIKNI